jgi:hypothetical protein
MRRRTASLALAAIAAALLITPTAGATPADPTTPTSIGVSSATVGSTTIAVTGTLTLGSDALSAFTVGTDAAGDASPANAGLDLGNLTVTPNPTAKNLKFSIALNDASAIGGTAPASGLGVPVVVDGEDHTWWLGGGNAGSNEGKTGPWTGLCTNENAAGTRGGWDCTRSLTGAMNGTHVEWTLGYTKVTPAISPGSTIDFSGAGAAPIPVSFLWPAALVLGGVSPADTIDSTIQYVVPGGTQLGIAPVGTPESSVDYTAAGVLNATAGTFTGSLAKPAAPGAYTVFVTSCYGSTDEPTCVTATRDITV